MPSKIRVLNDQTINKIAAGEVIENPASVVKELVENSIDAGAADICIEIQGGGRQLIRITDNGCGMNEDDALLSLERHATSKIKDAEDIEAIHTMGFRGEAIPSIAAISKFTLLTCAKEEAQGTLLIVEGGKIIHCSPAARSIGTTIEVKSLFFNVPVRRKFQKSPQHDAYEILKMISVLALGNPTIKFELVSNQKVDIQTSAPQNTSIDKKIEQRIQNILGKDFYQDLCPLVWESDSYSLRGWIGTPMASRPNRTGQYLFINGRPVFSPIVSAAIREGYGTALPQNRHPVFVLYLQMPGELLDVNVHPQKREVRLRQEQKLKEALREAVVKALQQINATPFNAISWEAQHEPPSFKPISPSFIVQKSPFVVREASLNIHSKPLSSEFQSPLPKFEPPAPKPSQLPLEISEKYYSVQPLATISGYILLDAPPFSQNPPNEGLCLVDQRKAHARVIFERLLDHSTNSKPIPIQSLLIPYSLETTPAEDAVLKDNIDLLQASGIHIHEAGPSHYLIDALPQVFGNTDIQRVIKDIIQSLGEGSKEALAQEHKLQTIALMAGRNAVTRTQRLSLVEAKLLLDQLMRCQHPTICPKGNAIFAFISNDELSKQFQKN